VVYKGEGGGRWNLGLDWSFTAYALGFGNDIDIFPLFERKRKKAVRLA
jgi:hypothetical protein